MQRMFDDACIGYGLSEAPVAVGGFLNFAVTKEALNHDVVKRLQPKPLRVKFVPS